MRIGRRPITLTSPLIVTAHLDEVGFALLDGLRRRHFPAARNVVPAHITLFHALPGERERAILADVRAVCARLQWFELVPRAPRFLGRGVALAYESAHLAGVHGDLSKQWRDSLTAQDKQPFAAHVTIQNKVTPHEARRLFEALSGTLAPACSVLGLDVWRYRGGPWEALATVPFGDRAAAEDRSLDGSA